MRIKMNKEGEKENVDFQRPPQQNEDFYAVQLCNIL